MIITISAALNEARLQGVINFLAQGSDNGWCEIYDDVQPAHGGAPTTLLVRITLVEAFGTLSSGLLHVTPTPEYLILASGIATWARFYNGNGELAFDCDASAINGNGVIKVASDDPDVAQLYAGGLTRISSGTLA